MAPLQMGLFGKTQAEVDQMEEEMKGMSEVRFVHAFVHAFVHRSPCDSTLNHIPIPIPSPLLIPL